MEITIPAILDIYANKYPDDEAIIFEDARATFGQLRERADKKANVLLHLGVKKGDHLAALAANCIELVEFMLAVWRIGAVFVPMNWRLAPDELIYVLNHSDAGALVFQDAFTDTVRKIAPSIPGLRNLLYMGKGCPRDFVDFETMSQDASSLSPSIEVKGEDLAAIMYTSGTTGRPKGVVAAHGNYMWACAAFNTQMEELWRTRPKSIYSGPYFHAGGLVNFLIAFFNASPQVVLKRFDPRGMLALIEKEKVNRVQGVATLYNMILQVPDIKKYDLSSVRILGSGAERMPEETRKRLQETFPGAGIWEAYGMTESCGLIATRSPEETRSKSASVGRPPRLVDVRVVDEHGLETEPGQPGEIIVRGPNIMIGYYKDPDKTAEALRDGWLYTSDLGWLDEEGFLHVIERTKDMIKTGGENIYPKEVERVLYSHPQIAEAAVFGLPDQVWGQKVCAAVVLANGQEMKAEEVISYCKEHLASFKKPKNVYFLETLPRTPSGKVKRSELRSMFGSEH